MLMQAQDGDMHLLHRYFEAQVDIQPENMALICQDAMITYQNLEERSNKWAHLLQEKGIVAGNILALLLPRSVDLYAMILAVLKVGAAYLPLDPEYPTQRLQYILSDCKVKGIITLNELTAKLTQVDCPIYAIDQLKSVYANQVATRINLDEEKITAQNLCYIIYTSGSTGRPKGVEITHHNVCNYLQGAMSIYGVQANDRVYQGFSVSFDASIEEIWTAFANGATLVVGASNAVHAGAGLVEFLNLHEITVFSTIPTLLSMLDGELPSLRLLILGGEVCPRDLVTRWSRPGLRILNTYGPTETTIVATYHECDSNKPITIGKPFPHYDTYIFDEHLQPVPHGTIGELYIGGPSLARGYVNKPELTQQKFISNPLKPSNKLYKTGDLAVKMPDGDIQFMGRADEQVKLRGYRIELSEIENVLLEDSKIRKAVVAIQELSPGVQSLVAYVLLKKDAPIDIASITELLHKRLPDYMVPSFFEIVTEIPMLSSGKVDRNRLPKPNIYHDAIQKNYVGPESEIEKKIIKAYEELFKQSHISITADFFTELGGHSLFAAKAVSILRKEAEMQQMSMLDIYENPTVQQLAKKYSHYDLNTNSEDRTTVVKVDTKDRSKRYWLCSLGQLLGSYITFGLQAWEYLLVISVVTYVVDKYSFISMEFVWSMLGLIAAIPLILFGTAVAAKWLLLGRIKPGKYPLWGWFYFRWWLVQRIIDIPPMEYIIGSPLMNLYCKLMGAKIGKNCYIGTDKIKMFDLFSMGDNASIGFESSLTGYVVEDGWLKIGSITVGDRCFIGTKTVLSINTKLENGAMLEDLSMLPTNGSVPKDECYYGSPARPQNIQNKKIVDPIIDADVSVLKNINYCLLHYLSIIFISLVYYSTFIPAILLIDHLYQSDKLLTAITIGAPLGAVSFLLLYYLSAIVIKKILFNKTIPGSYKLKSLSYLRYWIVERIIDTPIIKVMADSLYFPFFLRMLGAKIGKHVEIAELPHLSPDLLTMEDESFSASWALIGIPRVQNGYATFAPVKIGKRGFVGNSALLPPGTELGAGCLIGALSIPPGNAHTTKSDTAWFGSPAVFLPRREIFEGFSEKVTYKPPMSLYIKRLMIEFVRVILPFTFFFIVLIGLFFSFDLLASNFSLAPMIGLFPLFYISIMLVLTLVAIGIKWMLIGKLREGAKPVWSTFVWRYDVFEHLFDEFVDPSMLDALMGTPFCAFFFRLLGAKIGKRVYIGSTDFAEFDLTEIGNDVALNSRCIIQTHLYEDRIFKMGPIKIGDDCTIGSESVVLYNTMMEKNSTLDSLSLLMKGEILPHDSHWAGIPAQHVSKYASSYEVKNAQWDGIRVQVSTA